MGSLNEFFEKLATDYAAAVERGEHDDQCEYDPRGFYICHCKKRRREATGFTDAGAVGELYFPTPDCPRCGRSTTWDEGFRCDDCHLRWSEGGADASFTDEYGDDLAERSAEWKAHHDKRAAAAQSSDKAGTE